MPGVVLSAAASEATLIPGGVSNTDDCTKDSMNIITGINFTEDFRCFKKGEQVDFRPGINLLVGDQGTGKSTLLQILDQHPQCEKKADLKVKGRVHTAKFDFEKDNPRNRHYFSDSMDVMPQVAMMFMSHGELNRQILEFLETKKEMTFLLDEPDTALSVRSVKSLAAAMKVAVANDCQVIASVHNPILIESVPEVYSAEHRRWMPGREFIELHS